MMKTIIKEVGSIKKSEKASLINRFLLAIKSFNWEKAYSFRGQKALYVTSVLVLVICVTLALLAGYNIGLNSNGMADEVKSALVTVTASVKRMFSGEIKEVVNNKIVVTDLKGVEYDFYFSSTIIIVNNRNDRITLTDLAPGKRVVITYTEDEAKQKSIVRLRVY